jgi:hypothetical protein
MRKSVEQFMQEFFAERSLFNRKYFSPFAGGLNPEMEAERLETAETLNDSAMAVTRIDGGTHYARHRYHLRLEGESWIIERMQYQCGRCGGTGKKPDSDEPCAKCKGEGRN